MTRIVVVEGYTYERYVGYTYRKNRRGKLKRVHHFKTVVVSGYSYTIRVAPRRRKPTPKPKAKRKSKLKPKAPSKPKAKRKSKLKPKAPSKPKAKHKPKPKPKTPSKPKAKRKPKPKPKAPPKPPEAFPTPKGWIKAAEWQDFLEQWASKQNFDISWDGDIYKKSPANDWISRDLFVWPTPKYPRGLTLKKYPDVGTKIFYMARIWVLIEHSEDEEMFVWTRTARLRREMDFDEAATEISRLQDAISSDIEDFPYLAFRGLVGWTLYAAGTHAKQRRKKEGTQ